jgi:hypothetical protein
MLNLQNNNYISTNIQQINWFLLFRLQGCRLVNSSSSTPLLISEHATIN